MEPRAPPRSGSEDLVEKCHLPDKATKAPCRPGRRPTPGARSGSARMPARAPRHRFHGCPRACSSRARSPRANRGGLRGRAPRAAIRRPARPPRLAPRAPRWRRWPGSAGEHRFHTHTPQGSGRARAPKAPRCPPGPHLVSRPQAGQVRPATCAATGLDAVGASPPKFEGGRSARLCPHPVLAATAIERRGRRHERARGGTSAAFSLGRHFRLFGFQAQAKGVRESNSICFGIFFKWMS